MAHFLPPELVRQVNKLEWPEGQMKKNVRNHCNHNDLRLAQLESYLCLFV